MYRHLIQPRELYGSDARRAELLECWERNDALFDGITAPIYRPTFTELFELCKPDALNVIANSDIYFDATLPASLAPRIVDAISRWDRAGDAVVPYHKRDSQDAWIVYGRPDITADFTMGVPGCDNRLAWILQQAGYQVINPCRSIRAIHLHESEERTYTRGTLERIPPPYLRVDPCFL